MLLGDTSSRHWLRLCFKPLCIQCERFATLYSYLALYYYYICAICCPILLFGTTRLLGTQEYLGVEFDSKLSWKDQVQNVKAKGTKTLNMVRRNFTKGTNANIREQIYTSLVRPTLEYGSVAWDPHQANRIQMLESVQNKGARYVTQEWSRYSSITDIKDKLGWCTLQQRRYVNRLSFFFKSVNNLHGHSLPPHVTRQKRASKNHHAYSYHTLRDRCVSTLLPAPRYQSMEQSTPRNSISPLTRELQSPTCE